MAYMRHRLREREKRKLTLTLDYSLPSFLRSADGHIPALGSSGI